MDDYWRGSRPGVAFKAGGDPILAGRFVGPAPARGTMLECLDVASASDTAVVQSVAPSVIPYADICERRHMFVPATDAAMTLDAFYGMTQ